jgi:hypothetical protein
LGFKSPRLHHLLDSGYDDHHVKRPYRRSLAIAAAVVALAPPAVLWLVSPFVDLTTHACKEQSAAPAGIGTNRLGDLPRDLRCVDLSQARLSGADLHGAILDGADLSQADLTGANLSGASLVGATLIQATLSGAQLDHADLHAATFDQATMKGADLRHANLVGASLSQVDLTGADLRGATLWWVDNVEAETDRVRIGILEAGIVQVGYLMFAGAALVLVWSIVGVIRARTRRHHGRRVPTGLTLRAGTVSNAVTGAFLYLVAALFVYLFSTVPGPLWTVNLRNPAFVGAAVILLSTFVWRLAPGRSDQSTPATPELQSPIE